MGGVTACQEQASELEKPPAVVQVEAATLDAYAPALRLTGEIRARVESVLSFRVAGRITERLVNVGDHVTADQILAKLDPQQQEATVSAAEAAVRSAEAVMREATSTFQRQKALIAQGFTTRRDHDQAEENFRTAQASLMDARAQLGTARDRLSDTVLRAGVAGIITARNAEVGEVVQEAQSVFSIAQDGPRDAVFNVNEAAFTQELADPAVALTLVSDPTVTTTGAVREISPTVDRASGTVRVKVDISQPPAEMTLGAAVVGSVRHRSRERVVISWGALSNGTGGPAVWTVDPGTKMVSQKPIAIESYKAGKVVVREGLQPGEVVVASGTQFLRPRQVVAFAEGNVR
ncbi:efflux RND transporter periplasmic adaptor subunit [Mesorhizobium sp. L-8-3]|uniref:efflux RND transporter periplasmic adaptor subunit n=1 Tax=Mesorhizobium sp. L-8-3 TaxID=2744522 RepID=UPI001FD2A4D5|nr:efflux RND transporter periplasmic adaptor subunit [Mesorhizobium sp. L-8-3]